MNQQLLETIVIEPRAAARRAVIWMHGLGADAHDFEPIVPELGIPDAAGVRFIFPNAPHRPITINGGWNMRGWYDILGLGKDSEEDADGIRTSERAIGDLIRDQARRGILPESIVLAGFSQGGALALQAGLRYPDRLAGLLVLSSYLPLQDTARAEAHLSNRSTPIFMAHGTRDPIIPPPLARDSRKFLEEAGYKLDYREYPMEHSVCPQEIADLAAWLRGIFPA